MAIPTPLVPVVLDPGEQADEHVSASLASELKLTAADLQGFARAELRKQLDLDIGRQLEVVRQLDQESEKAQKALSDFVFEIPKETTQEAEGVLKALKAYFPHASFDIHAGEPSVSSDRYTIHVVFNREKGSYGRIFETSKTAKLPKEYTALIKANKAAVEAAEAGKKELLRLRSERSRLPELVEEAFSSVVAVQIGKVKGGEKYLEALRQASGGIMKRIGRKTDNK